MFNWQHTTLRVFSIEKEKCSNESSLKFVSRNDENALKFIQQNSVQFCSFENTALRPAATPKAHAENRRFEKQ